MLSFEISISMFIALRNDNKIVINWFDSKLEDNSNLTSAGLNKIF